MAILDCFDGLVGVSACNGVEPVLNLSAHGIDETLLGQLTGPEDTPQSMLAAVETRARAIVHNDVLARYASRIKGHTFLDRYAAGQPDDRVQAMTGTGRGGIIVEANVPKSNLRLIIGNLGIFSAANGPVTITVYDLTDGSVAATQQIAGTAGRYTAQTVAISLPAHRQRKAYFITHDLPAWYNVDLFAGCGSCGFKGYTHGGCTVTAGRIAPNVPVRKANIQSTSHTSGLTATVTVECDHAALLCEVRNQLALPYSLKVAEEVYRYGIHQPRRMNSERLNLELMKEKAERLGAEYVESMKNLMGNMLLPNDPFCFACKTPVQTTVVLP
jgi:hypothetical protein